MKKIQQNYSDEFFITKLLNLIIFAYKKQYINLIILVHY